MLGFKAKGQWIMSFDYGQGGSFVERGRSTNGLKGNKTTGYGKKNEDQFEATQRVRLQLDAVASESLSGTVFFEIGDTLWGSKDGKDGGGALGADDKIVEVKRAYLDWIVPNTDLKVRMGIQGIALPAYTTQASQILDDDVAGVVLSNKFNDNVTLTAFWARPYNDNFLGSTPEYDSRGYKRSGNSPANYMDNVDLFALLLPMSFDGVKVTPWGMLGFIGPNAFRTSDADDYYGNAYGRFSNGTTPAVWANKQYKKDYNDNYATGFWAGLTGEVTMWDPFRLAWDLNYGGIYNDQEAMNRGGFYGSLLGEYKLDWGTPGLYVWYSTGDDNNPKDGSERMATLDANGNNQFSYFGGNGNPYIAREGVLGSTLIGTWGVGGRIKDMSFMEGLKHTFRINYFGGTNSPSMAKYIKGGKQVGGYGDAWWQYNATQRFVGDFNQNDGLYLTTMDSALEFGLTTDYKIYDNLTFMLDAAYIALWLDQSKSVWGGYWAGGYKSAKETWRGANSITDAWNINASFVYDF